MPVKKEVPVQKVKPSVVERVPVVARTPAVKAVAAPRKVRVAKTVTTKSPTAKRTPTKKPAPAVASKPKRLHPDQLPGAVLTPVSKAPVAAPLVPRPSKAPANTPYGMADEAYLDGKWALSQQRSNLAIQSLQHALELYPGHLQARELLVGLLNKKGKSGEAMFLLAEGLEIAPDYMAFKKDYVKLLTEQGDYETAIQVILKGGLPAVDKDPEAHVLLASLYQKLGESFLAAQTYRNLLVSWPQTGAFWVGLGSALEKQKLSDEAVVCYQKALETKNLRNDLSAFARKRLRLLN
jgi:MSHA biogenesis protein MshN